jgi:tRNA U34 5-carboxymethylaminomethyl modifying enzyme MnmG/GidA
MPTKVNDEHKVTTQEGTELVVKPLTIRALREFMEVIGELNQLQEKAQSALRKYQRDLEKYQEELEENPDAEEPEAPEDYEFESIEIMVRAATVALKKHNPDFVADEDKIEDELDVPTVYVILEKAGGIKLGDDATPNLMAPAQGA